LIISFPSIFRKQTATILKILNLNIIYLHLLSEAILAEFEAGSLILALHEANRKCKDFEANARLKITGWVSVVCGIR
jgi:hypothetical protein